MDRRDFLAAAAAAGAAGAAGALLSACSPSSTKSARTSTTIRTATSVKPAGSDLGAIDHVVMVMQENRSFDHYFGTFPGVRGFDDHPADDVGVFSQRFPANKTVAPVGRLLPFHLDTANTDAECTFDLSHAWPAQHACWNHGSMDAFVTTHTSPEYEGPQNGALTMGYYTRDDLPFYHALAEAFTLCDGYHCSVLGPTDPNRMFWLSGTNDPDGRGGGPIITTNEESSYQWSVSWPTMPEALDAHGISWKVYNPPGSAYVPSSDLAMLVSNNRLLYFRQYRDRSSMIYHNAFEWTFPADFARDVANDTLPAVSWLVAPIVPQDMSEHPPAPPSRGEYYTHQVIQTLASNPKVWAKTVLFLSYDENDGFFDHVPPPTPPPGTAGEYLTVDPLPESAGGVAGPIGLGMRVPMLVISPFARGGHVFSGTSDHTSQLRFLETRFGVTVPNLSDWRRATTSDLTGSLQAGAGVGGLPSLPATALDDVVVERECSSGQQVEVNSSNPPDLVPRVQKMPTQDA
ncbi:MAG: alkaline phosphatase family protein [Acidimicrobiales bacterium]|jgi:phospholipase C